MQLSIQNIQPLLSGDFSTQLQSCLSQTPINSEKNKRNQHIVKITVFTSCTDNADYLRKMNLLHDLLSQSEGYNAPVSLVCQPPIDCETMIEFWTFDYPTPEPTFTFTQYKQSAVLHIDCPEFSCLFSTQYSAKHAAFKENTQEAFSLFDTALRSNGFDYHEIVRQWNYIENIIHVDADNDKSFQNYQIFNDLRSVYYGKSEFPSNLWPNAVQAYARWMKESIRANIPYDQFVRELLNSSGTNFRVPEVNFYGAFQTRDPKNISESFALLFLGMRPFTKFGDNKSDEALFSHYRIQRLTTEQLIDAICDITDMPETYWSRVPEPFTFSPKDTMVVQL